MSKFLSVCTLLAGVTLLAPLSAIAQTKAEDAKAPWSMTGNLNFVSEYRYRGINQTNGSPAIQGGFDWTHTQGFYVGTWASNVSWLGDLKQSNSLEWDFYGGYKGKIADLPYDVGALYYYYPGTYDAAFTKPSSLELYGALTWKDYTVKYSHAVTNLFGYPDSRSAGYLELNGGFELGGGFNFVGHLGHQMIPSSAGNSRTRSDCSYSDWKLGVTTDRAGFTWGLAYVDTNARGGTGQCYRNSFDKNLGKSTVVLSVGKTY
jgi:uncharacterized protein (TIGR02001 family)